MGVKPLLLLTSVSTASGSMLWEPVTQLSNGRKTEIIFSSRKSSNTVETTHTAGSDDISIEAGAAVGGKLETQGSWQDSLTVRYTVPGFNSPRPSNYVGTLGETFYVRVAWSVHDKPIGQKLKWYISGCTVKDLNEDGTESGTDVTIIDKVCYASVLQTTPKSAIISTKEFDFQYRSFSFNTAGNGKQKLACDINFCLNTETACLAKVEASNINCPKTIEYGWRKGPEL